MAKFISIGRRAWYVVLHKGWKWNDERKKSGLNVRSYGFVTVAFFSK